MKARILVEIEIDVDDNCSNKTILKNYINDLENPCEYPDRVKKVFVYSYNLDNHD